MDFSITIPAKGYVKKYLVTRCGDPADLHEEIFIQKYMIRLLDKNYRRFDRSVRMEQYPEKLDVMITEDQFFRWGGNISPTSVSEFNSFVEHQIKQQSRLFIMVHYWIGEKKSWAIRKFQETYMFTEDDFAFETIKKDFDRHVNMEDIYKTIVGKNVPKQWTT